MKLVVCAVLFGLAAAAAADPVKPVVDLEHPAPPAIDDAALYQCKTLGAATQVEVTLKPDSELKDLLSWAMGFTCKNFVLDPRVTAGTRKVTIVAPNRMNAAQAYQMFLVALTTINVTVVPRGNVMMVVDAPSAKTQSVPIVKPTAVGQLDQLVRTIIQPEYAKPETLQQGFMALKSDAGDIQTIGSLVLVTDYESHVHDMLALAKLIDVPAGTDGIYTIPVLHADAAKLAEKITQLLAMPAIASVSPPNGKAPVAAILSTPTKILVDDRTNTLLVSATQPGYERVQALVERLDIALETEGGSAIHVVKLGSAVSDELAKTLNDAISGQQQAQQGQRITQPTAQLRSNTTQSPTPAAEVPSATTPPLSDAMGAALSGQVRVISDPTTNSLLVVSSARDFFVVRDVIKQLDIPRRQVYVEALVMEIQIGNDSVLGFAGHAGLSFGGGAILGGLETPALNTTTNANIASSLSSNSGALGAIIGSALTTSQTLLGTSIPSYALLFQALESPSTINIVSAPSIIALDNTEAKYTVGETIPFQGATTYTGTGSASTPSNSAVVSIDHKDLNFNLTIKPHISSVDDSVLLEVKHDAVALGQDSTSLGPTWTNRAFETRVVVHDQETVMLGGLVEDKESHSESKIPILGDIPILGRLFAYSKTSKTKTNLVVMLTPYIIRDQRDLAAIRERKLREHEEFQRSIQGLDGMKFLPGTDYRKKRGLVEEINRAVIAEEEDAAARALLHTPLTVVPGPVVLPASHP
ncbi:MAG TPA: type II secretion system secretin GspD [Kofleriaceae bacterium]|jgi:general secretion pathway protein D